MMDATGSTGRSLGVTRLGWAASLLLAAALWAGPVWAEPLTVRLRAPDATVAQRFASLLESAGGGRVAVVEQGAAVTLALGEAAFRAELADPGHGPLLGLAVPRAAAGLVRPGCHCSAIWRGVPLATQLALIEALMPEAGRIGVLFGPSSAWAPPLTAPRGRLLEAVLVPGPARLAPLLRRHLPDWDALLLPEDDVLFGPGAAKLVLLTSYRQRVPVFGPGADFVHAGSVASAYLDPRDLARGALDWLEARRRHGAWPAQGFAGHYSLAVNDHVARAYGLSIVERARLERILETSP
ncbi:hypothetical protein ACLD02_05960 [Alloalcanivorax sp. C16-2]|uniref:hypothetical protein n=1 Tax=Alloalcanivorax TaxID=3020832 RepID=UPI0019316D82|nr:hypothetical protein [Alloalcanivorax marinus]MBL7251497.1 hypothetical protein [Alloalcanivorax marinus]